jgi:hypothetical protein
MTRPSGGGDPTQPSAQGGVSHPANISRQIRKAYMVLLNIFASLKVPTPVYPKEFQEPFHLASFCNIRK